jgi:hypothetical protein
MHNACTPNLADSEQHPTLLQIQLYVVPRRRLTQNKRNSLKLVQRNQPHPTPCIRSPRQLSRPPKPNTKMKASLALPRGLRGHNGAEDIELGLYCAIDLLCLVLLLVTKCNVERLTGKNEVLTLGKRLLALWLGVLGSSEVLNVKSEIANLPAELLLRLGPAPPKT